LESPGKSFPAPLIAQIKKDSTDALPEIPELFSEIFSQTGCQHFKISPASFGSPVGLDEISFKGYQIPDKGDLVLDCLRNSPWQV
jgi:hypothetical protein